ncbi:MAG: DUF2169 domain-containing protein, partial [Myxococcota bacterium]
MGIRVYALAGAAGSVRLWQQQRRSYASLVVKAQFALVSDDQMVGVASPKPVRMHGLHHGQNPARSLRQAAENVPYKRRADVTAVGHVYGNGKSRAEVRLRVIRGGHPILDKTVLATGQRPGQGEPEPFDSLPVVFEHARRTDENPQGRPAAKSPQLTPYPATSLPGGFGPVSPFAASRRRLGSEHMRDAVDDVAVARLPDDFDGAYFQHALPDQQVDRLFGDEWIVLAGWHRDRTHLASRLPSPRAEARLVALGPRGADLIGKPVFEYEGVPLAFDTLDIDADFDTVTALYRGRVSIDDVLDVGALAELAFVASVTVEDEAPAWPDPRALPALLEEHGAGTAAVAQGPDPQATGTGPVALVDVSGTTFSLSGEQREQIRAGG